jgi:hypothetical protein
MKTCKPKNSGELKSAIYDRAIDESRKENADLGKRRSPRVEATGPLKLVPVEGGLPLAETIAVKLNDVSRDGIGLIAGSELVQDSRHLVTLRRDGMPPMWLECAVRRCEKLGKNKYTIGAEFVAMHGQFDLSIWGVDVEQFSRAA